MGERIQRVSRSRPCVICGKPDWCGFMPFQNGDVNHVCARTTGSVGSLVEGLDGMTYRVKSLKDFGTVYETEEQFERNRQAFIESLPGYKGGKKGSRRREQPVKAPQPAIQQEVVTEGVAYLASPADLDRVYRAFLKLLCLEKKHEMKLRAEWDKIPGLYGKIMASFPIKSLPPEDAVRFSSEEKYRNFSRKKTMESLIEAVGEPKGVPGFYQRKDGRWTCYRLAGILFPVYNTKGQIIRLRVNDDYPDCDGEYTGKPCVFRYMRDDEFGTGWFAIPTREDGRMIYDLRELVWEYGSVNKKIELTSAGYPKGAKVNGKYKNFTSYQERAVTAPDGVLHVTNLLTNGCRSGGACSLYTKQGDDTTVVYATEGEKKAIVANMMLNVPVVSIPGVSNFNMLFKPEEGYKETLMEALRDRGMKLAVLVYDADKTSNEVVLRNEKNAIQAFHDNGVKIAVGEWNAAWGKGLDDILLEQVMPKVTLVA